MIIWDILLFAIAAAIAVIALIKYMAAYRRQIWKSIELGRESARVKAAARKARRAERKRNRRLGRFS